MTQEDLKQLLFKELCARLPYHVKCKIWLKDGTTEEGLLDLEHNYADVLLDAFYYNKIKNIKPYLRPMSSMTKEEYEEYDDISYGMNNIGSKYKYYDLCDWFNAHHFDYRGLLEKGLAIEAPEDMYDLNK